MENWALDAAQEHLQEAHCRTWTDEGAAAVTDPGTSTALATTQASKRCAPCVAVPTHSHLLVGGLRGWVWLEESRSHICTPQGGLTSASGRRNSRYKGSSTDRKEFFKLLSSDEWQMFSTSFLSVSPTLSESSMRQVSWMSCSPLDP